MPGGLMFALAAFVTFVLLFALHLGGVSTEVHLLALGLALLALELVFPWRPWRNA